MTTIIDLKQITDPIDRCLKLLGFAKVGKRQWHRETEEIKQVFLLDRFRYEPKNRLYIFGDVRRLNPASASSPFLYPMGGDVADHAQDFQEFMNALDQEYTLDPPSRRADIISSALVGPMKIFLESFNSEAGSLELLLKLNSSSAFHILPDVRAQMDAAKSL